MPQGDAPRQNGERDAVHDPRIDSGKQAETRGRSKQVLPAVSAVRGLRDSDVDDQIPEGRRSVVLRRPKEIISICKEAPEPAAVGPVRVTLLKGVLQNGPVGQLDPRARRVHYQVADALQAGGDRLLVFSDDTLLIY